MEIGVQNEVEGTLVKQFEFGCPHYQRKTRFFTPCCNKVYPCRFCHDEAENHLLDRRTVEELICCQCETRQKVQKECEECKLTFGKYACLECRLFDDEDKSQYHCDGCGICRVGGREKYFHCFKCNMCLPKKIKDSHKCIENVSRGNCPVCQEDIHTSRNPCHIPNCSHLIHKKCLEDMLSAGLFACPVCQTSILDMTELWTYFDDKIKNTPMPEECKNTIVDILCRDCHQNSSIPFHVVGLKCSHCGSYNTC